MVEMSKQQTGLRIDRVLFKQFQLLCALEKLRPGEAVESIVRLAVDSGSLADLHANVAERGGEGRALDEALFIDQTSPDPARSVAARAARPARRGTTSQYALRYSTTSNANRKS